MSTKIDTDNMAHVIEDNIEQIIKPTFIETIKPFLNKKETYAYAILSSIKEKNGEFQLLVKKFTKEYKETKLIEYKGNRKNKEYVQKVNSFTERVEGLVLRNTIAFVQPKVRVNKKIRIWRDYNLFAETPLSMLEYFGKMFEVGVWEWDIANCNIRIIYAFLGIEFNEEIYGEGKKYKKPINTFLNQLSQSYAVEKGANTKEKLKQRRKYIKAKLTEFNVDERVIDWLLKTFWGKHSDALFNFCAYHEKKLLGKLTQKLIERFEGSNISFIRRHDSIIVVGNLEAGEKAFIEQLFWKSTYLNVGKWFKGEPQIIEIAKSIIDVELKPDQLEINFEKRVLIKPDHSHREWFDNREFFDEYFDPTAIYIEPKKEVKIEGKMV